jgi:hypothetical protein
MEGGNFAVEERYAEQPHERPAHGGARGDSHLPGFAPHSRPGDLPATGAVRFVGHRAANQRVGQSRHERRAGANLIADEPASNL